MLAQEPALFWRESVIVVVILLQVFCENVVAVETTYPQMLDRDGLTSFNLDNTDREKRHNEAFQGVYFMRVRERKTFKS